MFEKSILHKLIKENTLKPREYQTEIASKVENNNLLCVLPTGLGKTFVGVLAVAQRFLKFPNSKAIILAPTRPLINQNYGVFEKYFNFDKNSFQVLTGTTSAKKRIDLYKNKKLLFLTPQTLENDLKNNLISLEDVSIIIFDECHRSVGDYSYVYVAQKYKEQSKFPRILGLTASPGSTKEKINEICNNIFIDLVEIKTEEDKSVKKYLPKKEIEWISVDLPEEYKEILKQISSVYKEKLKHLHNYGITKPTSLINKKDLLLFQKDFQARIFERDRLAYSGISLVAQLLKLNHMSELLETQGINSLKEFIKKLQKETSKASSSIKNNKSIIQAFDLIKKTEITHPKMEKLSSLILEQLKQNPNSRIIVFANFRFTVDEIINYLSKFKEIKPVKLIGQKEGLSQKQQVEVIKNFEEGIYNVMCTTSIGEEGIDVKGGGDAAIFYDSVPSSIRRIQRFGRVGRMKPGKIIFLITKGTRDEAYYWVSHRQEKKMKNILYHMKNKSEEQSKLN